MIRIVKKTSSIRITLTLILFITSLRLSALGELQGNHDQGPNYRSDSLSFDFFKQKLSQGSPKLILTSKIEKRLRWQLMFNRSTKKLYRSIENKAEIFMSGPLITRTMRGHRMLGVSKNMVDRMTTLGILYRLKKDEKILERINKELYAVSQFQDWNPKHFLDVGEMSFGVALGLDWMGEFLPDSTKQAVIEALIEKAIKPSYEKKYSWWLSTSNNWNQVCNLGIIAASLVVFEDNEKLAAKTLRRSIKSIQNGLKQYQPDGVYPEGPAYWGFGTTGSILTSEILNSALGEDYGIDDNKAFLESVTFLRMVVSSNGSFFNYGDNREELHGIEIVPMIWFAAKTSKGRHVSNKQIISPNYDLGRYRGIALIWKSMIKGKKLAKIPQAWKGQGVNPVAVFRGDGKSSDYFMAAKGGKAYINHGSMDVGSFVFDLDGERWAMDPGVQDYYSLEKTGFELWGYCQDCDRWKLLTKNNFGHSTITVNGELHLSGASAPFHSLEDEKSNELTVNLTALYGKNIKSAFRTFNIEDEHSLLIKDSLQINERTKEITWQLITTSDVQLTPEGAELRQNGKALRVENISGCPGQFAVVSLDPPPKKIDKRIPGLKRLEFRVSVLSLDTNVCDLMIRLSRKTE